VPVVATSDATVAVTGRVDALNAPELDTQLAALAERGHRQITLDLANATYLSSSGLRVLLLAHRRQQALGGRLTVIHVPARVMRVLRLAGFDRILDLPLDVSAQPAQPTPFSG
jgi:anti-sigma B factor antagonist